MKTFSHFSRSVSALLAATAFMVPLIASCGGGGSGGPKTPGVDSATPAPTSPSGSNASCNSDSFTPNYARSVSLLHWDRFPLRVYFVPNGQLSPSRQQIAVAGFNQWVLATGNRADYNVVGQEDNPNVTVSFYPFTGGSGDVLGTSTVTYDRNNVIRSARV